MLSIGAAAMLSAGLQLDTAVVERRFDDLSTRFDASIKGAFESIEGLLDDEDGTIACALEDVKQEIATVINTTFDPTKTTSVVARLNDLVDEAQDKITLNTAGNGGARACFVIEAKDSDDRSLSAPPRQGQASPEIVKGDRLP
jgi:hypothetical protein